MESRALRFLLQMFYIFLLVGGFSAFNIGQRGIRLDWIIVMLMSYLFYLKSCITKEPVKNFLWFLVLNICVLASCYTPLIKGNSAGLVDFGTKWFQFILGSTLFVICCNLKLKKEDLYKVVRLYVIICEVAALLGIIQLVGSYYGLDLKLKFINPGWSQPHSGYLGLTKYFERSTSFFSEPRQFGAFLITSNIIAIAALIKKFPLFKNALHSYVAIILTLIGIISSISTSAIYIYLLSLLVLSIYYYKNFNRFVIYGLLCLSILFTLELCVSKTEFFPILAKKLGLLQFGPIFYRGQIPYYGTDSFTIYIIGIHQSISMFLEHPLTGVSLNNIEYYWSEGGLHGLFMFLAETGILGMGSFLLFVIWFLKTIKLTKCTSFQPFSTLLDMSFLIVIVAIFKTFGTGLYNLSSTFFWGDLALAGLIFYNVKKYLLIRVYNNNS